MAVAATDRAELRRTTERWFVRRGVPHFIDDYSATSDIFTRAWPILGLVWLAEMVVVVSGDAPRWLNALFVGGAFALLLGSLAALNLYRDRQWYRRPESIGPLELAVFVLAPAIAPLVFDANEGDAGLTVAANLAVLAIVYVVTSYGLLPMSRWAVVQLFAQMGNVANLMIRSLPLLLIFTMFMFVNAELWKVATDIPADFLASALLLLLATGSLFLLLRLPREMEGVAALGSWRRIGELCVGTPVEGVAPSDSSEDPEPPGLGRRGLVNAGLVLFLSQSFQIVFVTLAIFAFYVLFGIFTISPDTISLWTGDQAPGVVAELRLLENDIVVTGALLRTAGFVAAIAGLQFTVSALTDSTYREEFVEENLESMRQNLAVRAVYLDRLTEVAEPA